MKLIDNSYNHKYFLKPNDIYILLNKIMETVNIFDNEKDWFNNIDILVNNWLQ